MGLLTIALSITGLRFAGMGSIRDVRASGAGAHPPGCQLLTADSTKQALLSSVLSADAFFRQLCDSLVVPDARGSCFQLSGRSHCLPTFLVIGTTKVVQPQLLGMSCTSVMMCCAAVGQAGTTAFFRYVAARHVTVAAPRECGNHGGLAGCPRLRC